MEFDFNPYLAFGWSIFAGFLMSSGAGGGGILAGIGHLSVLGIGDPNMVKVVNQILEMTSRIFSVPLYFRQKRLVWPLAISFGVGAPIGAMIGSWFSKTYLSDMNIYRPVFGVVVALVAARTLYEGWAKAARKKEGLSKAIGASNRMQQALKESRRSAIGANPVSHVAPKTVRIGLWKTTVHCGGEDFEFNPVAAAAGGFGVSLVGATLGVGGGFLVTPFMASVLLFPMFLVVGTSLVALMVPLAASVLTYLLLLNVTVDWWLVAVEVPGIVIGSFAGPALTRHMNDKALRLFVATILFAIGIYYLF